MSRNNSHRQDEKNAEGAAYRVGAREWLEEFSSGIPLATLNYTNRINILKVYYLINHNLVWEPLAENMLYDKVQPTTHR